MDDQTQPNPPTDSNNTSSSPSTPEVTPLDAGGSSVQGAGSKNKMMMIVVGVLVAVGLAAAAYFLLGKSSSADAQSVLNESVINTVATDKMDVGFEFKGTEASEGSMNGNLAFSGEQAKIDFKLSVPYGTSVQDISFSITTDKDTIYLNVSGLKSMIEAAVQSDPSMSALLVSPQVKPIVDFVQSIDGKTLSFTVQEITDFMGELGLSPTAAPTESTAKSVNPQDIQKFADAYEISPFFTVPADAEADFDNLKVSFDQEKLKTFLEELKKTLDPESAAPIDTVLSQLEDQLSQAESSGQPMGDVYVSIDEGDKKIKTITWNIPENQGQFVVTFNSTGEDVNIEIPQDSQPLLPLLQKLLKDFDPSLLELLPTSSL